MAGIRGAIPDFQLANPLYIGASVSFFTVDSNGNPTATLATLFAGPIGAQTALNPQTLDSEGKFSAPVYCEVPVIGMVTGPNVSSHATGVIDPRGTWRGNWAPATVYFSTDFVADPVSGNIYAAAKDFTSASTITADVAAGSLVLIIDQTAVISGGAALAIKFPVRVATTGDDTLSGLAPRDGVALVDGDRVLVKSNLNSALNGIYNAHAGAWTRSSDADQSVKFANGCIVFVTEGTISRNKGYQLVITTPFTLGTSNIGVTALNFPNSVIPVQFSAAPDAMLTAGAVGYYSVPFDCTITGVTLIGNAAGSIVIDIRKGIFANFPPTASIVAADPPTLSSQQSSQDTTLAGWTPQLSQGDILAFVISSVSGLNNLSLALATTRN